MDNDLMKELDGLIEDSQDVEISDFSRNPDGDYTGSIYGCEFKETKETKSPMFVLDIIIDGPTHVNQHEWKNYVLNSPENMKRFTTDLEKFGLPTSSMKVINEHLKDLIDVPVELSIKTGRPSERFPEGFRNVSVNPIK